MEEVRVNKENAQRNLQKYNVKFIKKINSGRKQPLYKQLEEEFHQKQSEEETKKKAIIEEIHKRKMSLDVNKLLEHAHRHDEMVERMRSENRQRLVSSHASQDNESMASHYRSKFY